MEPGEPPSLRGSLKLGGPSPDPAALHLSPADILRPRVLRPPVPHALGARADPHAAAASAGLLLVRGGGRAWGRGLGSWGPQGGACMTLSPCLGRLQCAHALPHRSALQSRRGE